MAHTNTVTRKGRILKVRIETWADECPDTSYLGKYSDIPEEGSIVCATGEFLSDVWRRESVLTRLEDLADKADWVENQTRAAYFRAKAERLAEKWEDINHIPERGREYRFFLPYAVGEKVGTKDWRTYAKQDYARMEALNRGDWGYIGIIAAADITLPGSDVVQKLTSGGLWGIESDSGRDYIESVETEELAALRGELAAAGFTPRQISLAFKKVERVDK